MMLGTATDIGKTWVTAALAEVLAARGVAVAVRKPAQSFTDGESTDADVLAQATGDLPERVCPLHRWYERPLAPPMAAEVLGRPPFSVVDLARELTWPPGVEVGLVEGAGGVRSPLAFEGDAVDLAGAIAPDLVVLVAGAGLGALNLARLSVDALSGQRVVVYLNRFDRTLDVHRRNREWLDSRMAVTVETDLTALADRLFP